MLLAENGNEKRGEGRWKQGEGGRKMTYRFFSTRSHDHLYRIALHWQGELDMRT